MIDTGPPTALRRTRRSSLGGRPTVLPSIATAPSGQLTLPIDGPIRPTRRNLVLPGVVHVSRWLDLDTQRELVRAFRRWAAPPAGLRHPRVPTGQLMSVQSVCLGWHWRPYEYSRTADDTDGAPVKPLHIDMRSGDLLVFGRHNRLIHHGVPKVHPGTGPPGLDLPPGRLSITVRETGLGR